MSRHTELAVDMTTVAGRAGLSARLRPASTFQDRIDACVADADRVVARRMAAQLAFLPLSERASAARRLHLIEGGGERISG